MYNSDHTATECIGQKKNFLLPPQSVDVLSRFIYTALCASHFLLALATLDNMTEIRSFQFMSHRPRWPRQESSDCRCCQYYHVTLANVNTA